MIIRNRLDDPTPKDKQRINAVHTIINHEIMGKLHSRGSSIGIKLAAFKNVPGGPLTNSEIDTLLADLRAKGWVVQEHFAHNADAMVIQIRTRKVVEPCL